jgi:hypothetical protein
MDAKLFSYKAEGIILEPVNGQLKLSKNFDRKLLLEQLKDLMQAENFKIDERTLDYKIIDGQLFIEGIAVENQEPKLIGFMSGK